MALINFLWTINQKINEHAKKFTQPYLTFAIFGIITYPFYYWLWQATSSHGYESLGLRLIVVFLCVLLALKEYWPEQCKVFFPLFWYATLLYSLPFLFTFFLLKNHMSYTSSMNTMTVLVLSILLLDFFSLLIILTLGITLGLFCFFVTSETFALPQNSMTIFITYGSIIFFGSIFSYRKDQLKEREKRISAEAANKAKSDFISNMEHDLRTPFAGIGGIAGVLDSMYSEKYPELKDLFKILVQSCTQWENIHNQIFEVIETQQIIKIEKFYLQDELDKLKELMEATSRMTGIAFNIQYPPREDTGKIETDRLVIGLIISNLVGNAFNFTEKGSITVKIIHQTKYFVIEVTDTGIGIAPDKLDYIFEKFSKISRSNTYGNVFKGMGLGLYRAREDAAKIKGTISVKSEPDKGSTFSVTLPAHYHALK